MYRIINRMEASEKPTELETKYQKLATEYSKVSDPQNSKFFQIYRLIIG